MLAVTFGVFTEYFNILPKLGSYRSRSRRTLTFSKSYNTASTKLTQFTPTI